MTTIEELERRVKIIEERNRKVEGDKAWETSLVRRGLLIGFTYLSVGLYLSAIGIANAWMNAVVPSVGFWLSTLTLPWVKKWWMKNKVN